MRYIAAMALALLLPTTLHVGVGGHLYAVDIFGAGAGKQVTMSWRKLS